MRYLLGVCLLFLWHFSKWRRFIHNSSTYLLCHDPDLNYSPIQMTSPSKFAFLCRLTDLDIFDYLYKYLNHCICEAILLSPLVCYFTFYLLKMRCSFLACERDLELSCYLSLNPLTVLFTGLAADYNVVDTS